VELVEFFNQLRRDVLEEKLSRSEIGSDESPYEELIFSEIVINHMAENGMTFEPTICHYAGKVGNAPLRVTGFSLSEDVEQLDLFVCVYAGSESIEQVPDSVTKNAAEQCLRFVKACVEDKLSAKVEPSSSAYQLVVTLEGCYASLEQIRIYVVTDQQTKAKNFKEREVSGKTIKLEVMDIERLYRHMAEGRPRDEIVINFMDVVGTTLPCVYVDGQTSEYDYALTAIPGEALRSIYERYGPRVLEANVRSFLSSTGKVNSGIQKTLKGNPERFMAYNNGIVLVVDELKMDIDSNGTPGILWLKGMQIVNGGQTTASLYFSKKKDSSIDLRKVYVPAKIVVIHSATSEEEEILISDISRFANSQNVVKVSDLSANTPYHIEIEKLSLTTYCPDGIGRWFYERAAGSYNTMLAREGSTPARLKNLRENVVPPSRKITKTDLAKYLNTWKMRPDAVSFGSQKNFERFMSDMRASEAEENSAAIDVEYYKSMVAKCILFKAAQKICRAQFVAFQANVTVYLVSLFSHLVGERIDFDRIWMQQDVSVPLKDQLLSWAREVNDCLVSSSGGRMLSEWAKRPECWLAVKSLTYSPILTNIPELRGGGLYSN